MNSETFNRESLAGGTWDRYSVVVGAELQSFQPANDAPAFETKTRVISMANCSVSGAVVVDFGSDIESESNTDRKPLAIVLLIITDVVATLQGTLLKILRERGLGLFSLLFVTSLIGAFFAGLVMIIKGTPFVREKKSMSSMLERGVLGGLANLCAFYAVSSLNLGVASCLMFTMPLWTAALSFVIAGQQWDRIDVGLALSCLLGVVLVTQIWSFHAGVQALGFGAALAFAIINADAALMVNTKLRNEAPISMVFATMGFGSLISGCIVLVQGDSLISFKNSTELLLVIALSLGLPLMMLTRNLAFTMSRDTSIATLLYLEIVLAFLWEYLLLDGGLPNYFQIFGSLLIIVGSCASVFIKDYYHKQKNKQLDDNDDGLKKTMNFKSKPATHQYAKNKFLEQFEAERDQYILPVDELDEDDDSWTAKKSSPNLPEEQTLTTNLLGD